VPLGESASVGFLMPESAPPGSVMTTEAWCYGESGEEVAYARLARPYRRPNIPIVHVTAPNSTHPFEFDASSCLELTEQRGLIICMTSELYQ
jgi:hypothetical protein